MESETLRKSRTSSERSRAIDPCSLHWIQGMCTLMLAKLLTRLNLFCLCCGVACFSSISSETVVLVLVCAVLSFPFALSCMRQSNGSGGIGTLTALGCHFPSQAKGELAELRCITQPLMLPRPG